MCTQKPPHDYSEQLYSKYKEAFNVYIGERVGTHFSKFYEWMDLPNVYTSNTMYYFNDRSCLLCESTTTKPF